MPCCSGGGAGDDGRLGGGGECGECGGIGLQAVLFSEGGDAGGVFAKQGLGKADDVEDCDAHG